MVRYSKPSGVDEDRCGECRGLMAMNKTGDSRTNRTRAVTKHKTEWSLFRRPLIELAADTAEMASRIVYMSRFVMLQHRRSCMKHVPCLVITSHPLQLLISIFKLRSTHPSQSNLPLLTLRDPVHRLSVVSRLISQPSSVG